MAAEENPLKKQIQEIATFLKNISPDARHKAMEIFASLSAEQEHANICADLKLGKRFLKQVGASNVATSKLALTTLVNMSSFTYFRRHLYTCKGAIDVIVDVLRDKECSFRDLASLILINFTQEEEGQNLLCQVGDSLEGLHVKRIVLYFSNEPRSKHFCRLNDVLCNVTQCAAGRKIVSEVIKPLVDILPWAEPKICRGVLGCIRNICFDHSSHEKLLQEDLGFIIQLQIFLCGPAAELDAEDEAVLLQAVRDKMDIDKERCSDLEVRKLLLEIALFLVSQKPNRVYLRKIGLYFIIREYDKWETDEECQEKCDELVQFLRRDDAPEPGEDIDESIDYYPTENPQSWGSYESKIKIVKPVKFENNDNNTNTKKKEATATVNESNNYTPSLFTKEVFTKEELEGKEDAEEEEESEEIDLGDMDDID